MRSIFPAFSTSPEFGTGVLSPTGKTIVGVGVEDAVFVGEGVKLGKDVGVLLGIGVIVRVSVSEADVVALRIGFSLVYTVLHATNITIKSKVDTSNFTSDLFIE
jgi:hypothetical protein